jgi:predicted nucleotidyltransferase
MQHSLASILLPEYRRKVLGLLLLHPDEALHGREIARRTNLPPGTLARELRRLEDVGLLLAERRGNQVAFRANRDSPVFQELASILRKTSGLADVVADALAPAAARIDVAFVFGSVAQGRETGNSDVDVMIIGKPAFAEVVRLLHPAQSALARDINPKLYSEKEFAKVARTDSFLRDVLAKPKIFLIGDEHDLAKLARHKS